MDRFQGTLGELPFALASVHLAKWSGPLRPDSDHHFPGGKDELVLAAVSAVGAQSRSQRSIEPFELVAAEQVNAIDAASSR
jgi:hypothetical protein